MSDLKPTLQQIELYKKFIEIAESHHMYADQIMAIAEYIDAEYVHRNKATASSKLPTPRSAIAEEFRIHLIESKKLKVVATGIGFDNIRIEPVSANCVIIHACR
nr:hypothetical protein [uncultured Draconibacterium sp.]